MSSHLSDSEIEQLAQQHGTPLFVVDCDQLRRQYDSLNAALPGVDLFYAIKAYSHPAVIETLSQCGAGFDLASSGEIELVRGLHINPRRTIHTHPIKKDRDIRDALRFGCTTFVVDNHAELKKFRKYRHRVGLLLRVSFRSPDAAVDLSKKFGCTPQEAPELLDEAVRLGIHIKGLSFHVGSQSMSPAAHVDAIERCAEIIRQHSLSHDSAPAILDIGGGFPVAYSSDTPSIEAFCQPIRSALQQLPNHIQVIAEPGRYLVAPAATSITSVMGHAERGGEPWYYLDDGVYGVYSGTLYDHATYPIRTLKQGATRPSVLAGPTCDSIDVVAEGIELPELEIGDLLVGEMMGAYTAATASDFNLLPRSKTLLLNEPDRTQRIAYIA